MTTRTDRSDTDAHDAEAFVTDAREGARLRRTAENVSSPPAIDLDAIDVLARAGCTVAPDVALALTSRVRLVELQRDKASRHADRLEAENARLRAELAKHSEWLSNSHDNTRRLRACLVPVTCGCGDVMHPKHPPCSKCSRCPHCCLCDDVTRPGGR